MYIETITDNLDTFRIERQKDSFKGSWYGTVLFPSLVKGLLIDNEEWIAKTLPTLSDTDIIKIFMEEHNLFINPADVKIIRKVVRKAKKLGWFDEIK